MVEGSSLENCRRGNPFVSSNLTASARKQKKPPLAVFFVSWRKRGGRLRALRVRFEGLRLQAQPSPNRPFAGRAAGSVARRGRALQSWRGTQHKPVRLFGFEGPAPARHFKPTGRRKTQHIGTIGCPQQAFLLQRDGRPGQCRAAVHCPVAFDIGNR